MKIGIGLPNPVPGAKGTDLVEFARRAEAHGFAGLATIDRPAYPSYDSLATLAAAAGATGIIGLVTNILVAPVYPAALLARSAASIDQLSGGRFTLGMAVGSRSDDFAIVGRDIHSRGRDFDDMLDLMHRAWRGEAIGPGDQAGGPICPTPFNGERVPVLIGGTSDRAVERAVRWGAGWTAGGAGPDRVAPMFERVRNAWRAAGRTGQPRLAALAYFSLGDDALERSDAYLRDYYGFLGPYAKQISDSALRSAGAIRDAVNAYRDAGATELYLDATVSSPDQVDRLADLVL